MRKEVVMKLSRGFIVVILILFVLMVLIEVKIPKRFSWEEKTYCHTDSNPFGAKLVDSILEASLKGNYEVKNCYLYTVYTDSNYNNSTILLVDYTIYNYEDDVERILDMLKRGQTIIFINNYFPDTLCASLDVAFEYNYDYGYITDYFTKADSTTLIWGEDSIYNKAKYRFRIFEPDVSHLVPYVKNGKSEWTSLLKYKQSFGKELVVAASRDYGKGKLILMTWPQVFTNYNVLSQGGAQLLMRLITQAGNKKVVRCDFRETVEYEVENNKSKSPLRVFLDNHSLRWAVYLTLLTILLSLFFTARRKQRVIPVIEPPQNQTLTMVKHIGLMHFRYHDNAGLVRDHYHHFGQEMMRKMLIDVNDDVDLSENLTLIKSRTGIDTEQLINAISRIREIVADDEIKLSNKETKYLIDLMNSITYNL